MPVLRTKLTNHTDAVKENDVGLKANDHVLDHAGGQAQKKLNSASQLKRFSPVSRPRTGRLAPLCKKYELQSKLMTDLSSALNAEDISNLKTLGDRLAPIARAVISQEPKGPGRPTFHCKIAQGKIFTFFDEHEALHSEGPSRSIFTALLRTDSQSSNETLESVLHVLAALFVLTGPLIFTRHRALLLLHRVYKAIPTRRSNRINKLRILAWRCLLWSFSRMVDWDIIDDGHWRSALQVIGSNPPVNDVEELVEYLIHSHYPSRSDFCSFPGVRLAMLVIEHLAERSWNHSRTVAFDILRRCLLGRSEERSTAACHTTLTLYSFLQIEALLNNVPIEPSKPRQSAWRTLSLDEVIDSWTVLIPAWYAFVRSELYNAIQNLHHLEIMTLTDDILEIWRILLRATGPGISFSAHLCNVHISLIEDSGELGKKGSHSDQLETREVSVHAIQAVTKLWSVAVEELEDAPLSATAEEILRILFEGRDSFVTFLQSTERAWNNLIRDIVLCDPQSALAAVETVIVDGVGRSFVQQQTWSDLVHYTVLPELVASGDGTPFSVEDLIGFLNFPYKMKLRDMDGYTSLLWNKLLKQTFPIADARGEVADVLEFTKKMDEAVKAEEEEEEEWEWE